MNKACIDASVWIKLLSDETDSDRAHELLLRMMRQRVEIVAPSLMKIEVGSVLRKKRNRNILDHESLEELWRKFLSFPIRYVENERIYDRAWEIASANKLVHLYDAVYLAISEGIEFWTADKRLVHSITSTEAKIMLL